MNAVNVEKTKPSPFWSCSLHQPRESHGQRDERELIEVTSSCESTLVGVCPSALSGGVGRSSPEAWRARVPAHVSFSSTEGSPSPPPQVAEAACPAMDTESHKPERTVFGQSFISTVSLLYNVGSETRLSESEIPAVALVSRVILGELSPGASVFSSIKLTQ